MAFLNAGWAFLGIICVLMFCWGFALCLLGLLMLLGAFWGCVLDVLCGFADACLVRASGFSKAFVEFFEVFVEDFLERLFNKFLKPFYSFLKPC